MGSVGGGARHMYRVFLSNLPWTIGTGELRAFGSQFGNVVHSHVVFDKNTGMNKGYGFLAFANKEAFDALTNPGSTTHLLEGSYVHVNPATDRF